MSSNPEAAQSLSTADKEQLKTYRPSKPIRILTATSLFDGHDAKHQYYTPFTPISGS